MWQLTPNDLAQLKGSGGERFAHFVDRLIRTEAAIGGLPQSEITTQLRANIKDGGVDTQVKQAIPDDKSGWFNVPTCWQFKTENPAGIDDSEKKTKNNELQAEINKPYARHLIENGHGYRLCLLGDLTPPKLADWEAQLQAEAIKINPQAPPARVVHGGHLIEWAERFPGVVLWLRPNEQMMLHWEAWERNQLKVTPAYVPCPEWDAVQQRILKHVQLDSQAVREACLFVGGAAGVGKSRLVYQSLTELEHSSSLCVITEDDQAAQQAAVRLANDDQRYAILVADECSPEARHFLNLTLRGHTHRVRVISIDNRGEMLATSEARISLAPEDALKNAEGILEANFKDVPADRRRQYAQLSRGFIRLAADMCAHDMEIASGDMAGVLATVERYVRHRLRVHIAPLSLLALFHKVGFRGDLAGELQVLSELTGVAPQGFRDAVRAVRESPGFVVIAGRYWYVTPEIVAQVLFNEGWQRWVSPDLQQFFRSLSNGMQLQLMDRVATHARREVREEVRSFFRSWFAGLTAQELASEDCMSLAAALAEAGPEEYLSSLRAVIDLATPQELRAISGYGKSGWGPRRTLVWLLERLVSFPEMFEDCEAILFRLALEESEPQIGNNATKTWANLFGVFLSGSSLPFDQRIEVLRRRIDSEVASEIRLAFMGVSRVLDWMPPLRAEGNPVVAGRLRPRDWQPASASEERACYLAALEICASGLKPSGQIERHRLAFDTIIRHVPRLLTIGLLDDLRRLITPDVLTEEEARKVIRALDTHVDRVAVRTESQLQERDLAVRDWADTLRPADFAGRLRSICAREPWHAHLAADRNQHANEIAVLADEIINTPDLLDEQLDWLASSEAQSAQLLGSALGQRDVTRVCARAIFEHAIASKAAPLLRGYVHGMANIQACPSQELLDLMTTLEAQHPELAFDMLAFAGDKFDALTRILRLVDTGAISTKYLGALAYNLGNRTLTCDEFDRLIPYFERAGERQDTEGVLAGVRFVGSYLMFEASTKTTQSCLDSSTTQDVIWKLMEHALPFMSTQTGGIEVVKRLATGDAGRAATWLGRAMMIGELEQEAASALADLAANHPQSVMGSFGEALLDTELGWRLQLSSYRDLIEKIPPETILAWVRQHGVKGAIAIARHLPRPHLDEEGTPIVPVILDSILREYSEDAVLSSFVSGIHSGVYWVNGDEFRRSADVAKRFLDHSNSRIRQWAKHEIAYWLDLAADADLRDSERVPP